MPSKPTIRKGGLLYYVSFTDASAPVLETWQISSVKRRPRPRYTVLRKYSKGTYTPPNGEMTVYLHEVRRKDQPGWLTLRKHDFPLQDWPNHCIFSATPKAAWRAALPRVLIAIEREEKWYAEEAGEVKDPEDAELHACYRASMRQLRANRTRIEKEAS